MTVDEIKAAINNAEHTILTVPEVAKLTGTTPRNVSRWIDSGRLRGYRIPRCIRQDWRIRKECLLEFVRKYPHAVVVGQKNDAHARIFHHADCWREHHECAVKRVKHLEEMLGNSEATATYYNHEFMRLQHRVWELEAAAHELRDTVLNEHDGLEVNYVLDLIDSTIGEVMEPTKSPTE